MLGAIIGDIVGSRFEFANTHRTDFELFADACNYTDDTICTIAVADALLGRGDLLHLCRRGAGVIPILREPMAVAFISGSIRIHRFPIGALAMAAQCVFRYSISASKGSNNRLHLR